MARASSHCPRRTPQRSAPRPLRGSTCSPGWAQAQARARDQARAQARDQARARAQDQAQCAVTGGGLISVSSRCDGPAPWLMPSPRWA
eukprot:scaffold141767_cov142-Phaeocystis_antarctica.AAC.1